MNELLSFQLTQFAGLHKNSVEKLLNEIGLHSGQFFVLESLNKQDGQSQSELSRNLQISPPTVYNTVIRMAEADLVEIRKCLEDARIMRVYLTEKGSRIFPQADLQWKKFEEKLFQDWAETEKLMFSLLLKKLKYND